MRRAIEKDYSKSKDTDGSLTVRFIGTVTYAYNRVVIDIDGYDRRVIDIPDNLNLEESDDYVERKLREMREE